MALAIAVKRYGVPDEENLYVAVCRHVTIGRGIHFRRLVLLGVRCRDFRLVRIAASLHRDLFAVEPDALETDALDAVVLVKVLYAAVLINTRICSRLTTLTFRGGGNLPRKPTRSAAKMG